MYLTLLTDMEMTWTNRDGGRESDLHRLNRIRNDVTQPRYRRLSAAKAHAKIVAQLSDRQLMALRERLVRASMAKDLEAANRITRQIRDYEGADRETGDYSDES